MYIFNIFIFCIIGTSIIMNYYNSNYIIIDVSIGVILVYGLC